MSVGRLIYVYSSPEPKTHKVSLLVVYQWSVFRRRPPSSVHTVKNIFSSETTEPIEVRFYMEHLCLFRFCSDRYRYKKVYITCLGHMALTAAMPIYSKISLKIFSRIICQMALKRDKQKRGLMPYNFYINDDRGLTLTYFTARSSVFI